MYYSFSFLSYLDLSLVLVRLFQESVHFPCLERNQTLLSPCLSQEWDRRPGLFFAGFRYRFGSCKGPVSTGGGGDGLNLWAGRKALCVSAAVSFRIASADVCEFSVNSFLCTAANTQSTKDICKCSAVTSSVRLLALECF